MEVNTQASTSFSSMFALQILFKSPLVLFSPEFCQPAFEFCIRKEADFFLSVFILEINLREDLLRQKYWTSLANKNSRHQQLRNGVTLSLSLNV